MKVYKVLFEGNRATKAIPSLDMYDGSVMFGSDHETVKWLALESPDELTAMEIAERVVNMIWGKRDRCQRTFRTR